jgi:hypothetical protein
MLKRDAEARCTSRISHSRISHVAASSESAGLGRSAMGRRLVSPVVSVVPAILPALLPGVLQRLLLRLRLARRLWLRLARSPAAIYQQLPPRLDCARVTRSLRIGEAIPCVCRLQAPAILVLIAIFLPRECLMATAAWLPRAVGPPNVTLIPHTVLLGGAEVLLQSLAPARRGVGKRRGQRRADRSENRRQPRCDKAPMLNCCRSPFRRVREGCQSRVLAATP